MKNSGTVVVIDGRVKTSPEKVAEYGVESIYSITIETKRLSDKVDCFVVNYSSGLDFNPSVGDYISVEGSLRSTKAQDITYVFVSADSIKPLDGEPTEYKNLVKLYNGELVDEPRVRKAYNNDDLDVCDFCVVMRRAYNKVSYVHGSAWKNNARLMGKMNKGDKLSVEGRLQSHKNSKGNLLVNVNVTSFIIEEEKESEKV